jgi:hypothetical protein
VITSLAITPSLSHIFQSWTKRRVGATSGHWLPASKQTFATGPLFALRRFEVITSASA